MIGPRPDESYGERKFSRTGPQGLGEVGAVLLGDVMQAIGERRARGVRDRVEVADHDLGHTSDGEASIGPAVDSDEPRCQR